MMIRFEQGGACFNYRIAGVALRDDGAVLLHQGEGDEFWALPGGRAELCETAAATLRREMLEELGVAVEVERPLWFVESFFEYAGQSHHEIALYFLMRLPDGCKYLELDSFQDIEESGTRLTFRWFARQPETLRGLPLLPSFLQASLAELPATVQHVVHYDE